MCLFFYEERWTGKRGKPFFYTLPGEMLQMKKLSLHFFNQERID